MDFRDRDSDVGLALTSQIAALRDHLKVACGMPSPCTGPSSSSVAGWFDGSYLFFITVNDCFFSLYSYC